jgi:hypothetical protein
MKGHSQFFADGLVIALLAMAVATAASAQTTEPRRVELTDVVASAGGPLAAVKVSAIVEEKQSRANGLQFTLVLLNSGSAPLTVLDPAELIQPQLTTAAGWPVELPQVVPGWRIRRETPKTVVLQPSQEHRVPVTVSRILANQEHVAGSSAPAAARGGEAAQVAMPNGPYKLKLRLVLGGADVGAAATRPRTLDSPEVSITVEP